MRRTGRRVVLAALGMIPVAAAAVDSFRTTSVVLYQPGPVVQERLSGDVNEFAEYLKRLETESRRFFPSAGASGAVDIVVALKPGRRSRIWFANAAGVVARQDLKALATRLEKVPPAQVTGGPVAVAIRGSVRGGEPVALKPPPPVPDAWRTAIRARGGDSAALLPDEPLRVLWPD